jgi:hypothetical protein
LLHVKGNVSGKDTIIAEGTSVNGYASLGLYNSDSSPVASFGYGNASAATYASKVFFNSNSKAFSISTNNGTTEQFSIDTSGNVGIGTVSPDTKLQVVGAVKIGDDNTNYTNFDTTGHQTMVGTAQPWEDIRIEPSARTSGSNAPTFEKWYDNAAGTSRGVYLYSFDNAVEASEKEVFFTMQMPHAWNGGNIQMHVHWVPNSTENSTDVIWGLEYVWKDIGEVYGDTTTITSSTTLVPDDANITAGKHYISTFTAIAPGTTADGISSIFIGRLYRNSSNASDTYTDKVGLLSIDAHYQINSIGSNDEFTK